METIEMQLPFNTTLDEGIKMLRQKAEQTGMRVIAKFNGFILDSQYSDEEIKTRLTNHFRKKITDRETCNIDWEQRRYEIAKEMLHDCVEYYDDLNSIINVDVRVESSTELAIKYADALIEKLKRKEVQND